MRALALAVLAASFQTPHDVRTTTWIFIRTGPHDADLPADEKQTAMAGHFSNMTRMTAAGDLLVAGPLGPPKSAPDHRGIFVIDEPDPEAALAIAASDPAVQAGVFVLEAFPWTSADPMQRIVELDRADLTARAAASPTGAATWEGRAYILVTASNGAAAERALEPLIDEELVLFRGVLGGEKNGTLLACLNVTTADEAQAMLASVTELADEAIEWVLHGWYASNGLVRLPFVRAHPTAPTFDVQSVEDSELYARRVVVFGVPVLAGEGVPDRVTLRMAHLLAQYLDPDEDGEPDAGELPEMALMATQGTPENQADRSVREALERAGFELPKESPDGGYRVD